MIMNKPGARRLRHFSPCVLVRAAALLAVPCACLILSACAARTGYLNRVQPSLVAPAEPSADSSKPMYLDLIRKMQQQGAYYASLAHIAAFQQRYGNPPELRLLQADALRETNQLAAASPIYQGLLNTDQSAAAWHGLGMIAATQQQGDQAEHALAKAVQIDPINASYLGDLGYQRLRSGQVAAAHEPLAKAAELAPGNVKAISNLVLWMLLSDHPQQAEAAMQQANLPAPTRVQVHKLAAQLRVAATVTATPPTPPPTAAPMRTDAAPAIAAAVAPRSPRRVAPPQTMAAAAANAASVPPPPAQSVVSSPSSYHQVVGVPAPMLERFGSAPVPSEVHP